MKLNSTSDGVNSVTEAQTVVIGSGPAALSAVWRLVDSGLRPLVLDIGATQSDESTQIQLGTNGSSDLAKKLRFSSDHMYRFPRSSKIDFSFKGSLPISSAFGGLSTVWGTNLQGFSNGYGSDKINAAMGASFQWILDKIPHTGRADRLDEVFNWPVSFPDQPVLSQRMETILGRASSKSRWVTGAARNAVKGPSSGCIMCGQCVKGCPEGALFSTESPFSEMIRMGQIEYRTGMVEALIQSSSGWEIRAVGDHNEYFSISSNRVFLAAGSISSAAILVNSGLVPEDVELDDSQVFYLPFIAMRDRADENESFSLAQLFHTSKDGMFLPSSVHFSLYDSPSTVLERARDAFPRLSRLIPNSISQRIIVGIGFISPSKSGKISIAISNASPTIRTIGKRSRYFWVLSAIFRSFGSFLRIGLIPAIPLTKVSNVGASYHVGRLSADSMDLVDDSGTLPAAPGLFLVDGLSLKRVPAGPITLSIMANSDRITKEALGA